MTRAHLLLPLGAALALACALGPDYERPALPLPDQHRGVVGAAEAASLADLPWWEVFGDPALEGLVTDAVAGNRDLAAAAFRVEVALAGVGVARSPLFPEAGYGGDAVRAKNIIQLGDVGTLGDTGDVFQAGVTAFWEIDLWGRVRRSTEAAQGELFATEAARRGILASIVAQVAESYFELIEVDAELEITRRSAEGFLASRDLFDRRFTGGAGSRLPGVRAETLRAATAALVPVLEARAHALENRIALLLGRAPGPIERAPVRAALASAPSVPAGLPSTLLERRPDLQEAEGALRAANARIGVAVADFFPRIGLTGLFGTRSDELAELTNAEGVEIWALGGGLAGPIFDGGLRFYLLRGARRAWEEARSRYEQTALNAFGEVSDALVEREKVLAAVAERENAVAAALEAVRLSRVRYDQGLASYFEVLDSQQRLFPEELELARTRLDQQRVLVRLYRALGGGWERPVRTPSAP